MQERWQPVSHRVGRVSPSIEVNICALYFGAISAESLRLFISIGGVSAPSSVSSRLHGLGFSGVVALVRMVDWVFVSPCID